MNLYIGYQPTPDVLASFGIDNLFNQYYVQYMNAEGQSAPGAAAGDRVSVARHHVQGWAEDSLRRVT